MTFSHFFNGLAKILFAVIGFGLVIGVGYALELTPFGPESMDKHGYHPIVLVIYYLCLVVLPLAFTWRFLYLPYLMPAANWLFLLVFRKTKIPWGDCVRLSTLFVDGKNFMWYPVEELPRIPEDQRLAYLYGLAEKSGRLKPPRNAEDLIQDTKRSSQPVDVPQAKEPERSFWKRELSQRGIGAVVLVCGLALTYLSMISPLLDAARKAESVTVRFELAIIVPLALVTGLVYTLFGDRAAKVLGMLGPRRRPTALGWVFVLVLVGVGFLLFLWLNSTLRSYGYAA